MNKVIDTSTRLFLAIVGPSGSGKTELIFKLLKGKTFYPKFQRALYFYKEIQPLYSEKSNTHSIDLMVFILILLAFCIFKLSLTQLTREETSVWFSILSGLVGYVLPNPRI